MKTEKCGECKGSGYWANYPPPPDYVLDMNDCCGICSGSGSITTSTQPCPKCGSDEPHVWESYPYEHGALWCNECDHSFPADDGSCGHGTPVESVCEACNAGMPDDPRRTSPSPGGKP